jgi:hypothetical protein
MKRPPYIEGRCKYNNQLGLPTRGGPPALELVRGLSALHYKKKNDVINVTQGLELGPIPCSSDSG